MHARSYYIQSGCVAISQKWLITIITTRQQPSVWQWNTRTALFYLLQQFDHRLARRTSNMRPNKSPREIISHWENFKICIQRKKIVWYKAKALLKAYFLRMGVRETNDTPAVEIEYFIMSTLSSSKMQVNCWSLVHALYNFIYCGGNWKKAAEQLSRSGTLQAVVVVLHRWKSWMTAAWSLFWFRTHTRAVYLLRPSASSAKLLSGSLRANVVCWCFWSFRCVRRSSARVYFIHDMPLPAAWFQLRMCVRKYSRLNLHF